MFGGWGVTIGPMRSGRSTHRSATSQGAFGRRVSYLSWQSVMAGLSGSHGPAKRMGQGVR